MSWSCPPEVEDALWLGASAVLPAPALEHASLVRAIVERSRRYTSERERLGAPMNPPAAAADVAARALFFAVADVAKVLVPLAELGGRGLLPAAPVLRVLDVGAGAGAMSLGALLHLARQGSTAPVELTVIDRDAPALAIAERALADCARRWHIPLTLRVQVLDLRQWQPQAGACDLVLAGAVLNELEEELRRRLLTRLLHASAPAGAVVVIEPALRETARALHALRDWVLAEHLARVFAPCTRRQAPCPALADARDWCHEDRPTALPPRAAALTAATGLREHGLKFAYLVLRHGDEALVAAPPGARALRVVSRPRKLKGRWECFACGEGGRDRLHFLRRHGEAHAVLARAARGDVLIEPPAAVEPAVPVLHRPTGEAR